MLKVNIREVALCEQFRFPVLKFHFSVFNSVTAFFICTGQGYTNFQHSSIKTVTKHALLQTILILHCMFMRNIAFQPGRGNRMLSCDLESSNCGHELVLELMFIKSARNLILICLGPTDLPGRCFISSYK